MTRLKWIIQTRKPIANINGSKIAKKYRHVCGLQIATYIGGVDIGQAVIGGKKVWISWGRNLPSSCVNDGKTCAGHEAVWCGADDGSVEVIIPNSVIADISSVVIPKLSEVK